MRRKLDIFIFSCIAIMLVSVLTWGIIGCSKGSKESSKDKGVDPGTAPSTMNLDLQADPPTVEIGATVTLNAGVFDNGTGAGMSNVVVHFRLVSSSNVSPAPGGMSIQQNISDSNRVNDITGVSKIGDKAINPVGSVESYTVKNPEKTIDMQALREVNSLNELYERNLLPQEGSIYNLDNVIEGAEFAQCTTSSIGICEIYVTSFTPDSSFTIDFFTDSGQTSNSVTINFDPLTNVSCYLTFDESFGSQQHEIINPGLLDLFVWYSTPEGTSQIDYFDYYSNNDNFIIVDPDQINHYLILDVYLAKLLDGSTVPDLISGEAITFYSELNGSVYNGIKFSNQPPSAGAGSSQIDITTDTEGKARVYCWGDHNVMGSKAFSPIIYAKVREYNCPSGDPISEDFLDRFTFSPEEGPCELTMDFDDISGSYKVSIYDEENPGVITVTLQNASNLPVKDEIIEFSAYEGASTTIETDAVKFKKSPAEVLTDQNGQAQIIFWGTEVGDFNISAFAKNYLCLGSQLDKVYRTISFTEPGQPTFTARVTDPQYPSGRSAFWVDDILKTGTLTITLKDHNNKALVNHEIFVWAGYPGATTKEFTSVVFLGHEEEKTALLKTGTGGIASVDFYSTEPGTVAFVGRTNPDDPNLYTYLGEELDWAVSPEIQFLSPDSPCLFEAEIQNEDSIHLVSETQKDFVTFTLMEFDYERSDAENQIISRKAVQSAEIIVQVFQGTTGTSAFDGITFSPPLEENIIFTDADGLANAGFYVNTPGTFRIRGTLKDATNLKCFEENISIAETNPITYTYPQACYVTCSIKDEADNNVIDAYAGSLLYAEVQVRSNDDPTPEGVSVTFTISPEGCAFVSSGNFLTNITLETDEFGIARAYFQTKTPDISGKFTVEASITDAPEPYNYCIGQSAKDVVTFATQLYKLELSLESNDPIDPNYVLGDGKTPMNIAVKVTSAGDGISSRVDLAVEEDAACFENGNTTDYVITDKNNGGISKKANLYSLHVVKNTSLVDKQVNVSATATVNNISISDSISFKVRGIYIENVIVDDSSVRSDDTVGTNVHVLVKDTAGYGVSDVLVGGSVNGNGGGFSADGSGNPIKEAFWYSDPTGSATNSIYGFCCGYPDGFKPQYLFWISKSPELDSQLKCSGGTEIAYTTNDLVTWLPGPDCYQLVSVATPANEDTGQGEVCYFQDEGGGVIGGGSDVDDQCHGELDLYIIQSFGCDMTPENRPVQDFEVDFIASGNLKVGLTEDSINQDYEVSPGGPFGYQIFVDVEAGSGGGTGEIAYIIEDLNNLTGTHSFRFSEDFCLKIEIVNGSSPLSVGSSITFRATGGCGDRWDWVAGTQTGSGTEFTYVASEDDAGNTITVTVTDNKGDTDFTTVSVQSQATATEEPSATPETAPKFKPTPKPGK